MTLYVENLNHEKNRSATRRWTKIAPKQGKERTSMLRKCGSKCFLLPSEKKFPICTPGSCRVNCKGLAAAKIRASQWGYNNVRSKAQHKGVKAGCSWAKRSRSRRKSRRKSRSRKKSRSSKSRVRRKSLARKSRSRKKSRSQRKSRSRKKSRRKSRSRKSRSRKSRRRSRRRNQ